jgi:hypothetical protein
MQDQTVGVYLSPLPKAQEVNATAVVSYSDAFRDPLAITLAPSAPQAVAIDPAGLPVGQQGVALEFVLELGQRPVADIDTLTS